MLGGFLTGLWGWRSIFFVTWFLGLMLLLLALWKLEGEWAEAAGERFDWLGAAVYGVSLAAAMLGFPRLPSPLGIGLILAGAIGLVSFVAWETRTASPILGVHLFRGNPAFGFSNLAALINYSATAAVTFLLSLYLQYIKGLNPQDTGLILVTRPIFMATFSPLAGRLSDRIEPRIVASFGMGIVAVGLVLLGFINDVTSILFIILSQIFLGLGFALFSSPNTNAMMSSVE